MMSYFFAKFIALSFVYGLYDVENGVSLSFRYREGMNLKFAVNHKPLIKKQLIEDNASISV